MNIKTSKGAISDIRPFRSAESSCRVVYIVGGNPSGRRAMSALLAAANYRVRSLPSGEALLSAVDENTIGILILDLSLTVMPGLALQSELKARGIGLKTIFISDTGTIETSVQVMKNGAIDFLEKPPSDEHLLNSVAEALALAIADEKNRRRLSEIKNRYDRLTQREREVMSFLIRGESSRKLAERFGLSSRTVEIHRSKIMRKLEAGSLPDLVRMVYTSGGFQPEEFLVDISQPLQLRKDQVG